MVSYSPIHAFIICYNGISFQALKIFVDGSTMFDNDVNVILENDKSDCDYHVLPLKSLRKFSRSFKRINTVGIISLSGVPILMFLQFEYI